MSRDLVSKLRFTAAGRGQLSTRWSHSRPIETTDRPRPRTNGSSRPSPDIRTLSRTRNTRHDTTSVIFTQTNAGNKPNE